MMLQANTNLIKLWQWPNVLAIDAALTAVLWQAVLANALGVPLTAPAYVVLGLSVWLTYVADRLYDVKSRDEAVLLSTRHQFAKRFRRPLWLIWFAVLTVNLLSATQLSLGQLNDGARLLVACLCYTLLNQKLSRRFFPKEVCVALIYAGGVVVFLPDLPRAFTGLFALLCLLNCLMIGAKETGIDAKMRVHSMAPLLAERWLAPLAAAGVALAFWVEVELCFALAVCFSLLGILYTFRRRMGIESFRVLADTALLVGALIAF